MSSLYVAICLCKVYENVSGAFKGTALHELEHPSQKVFAVHCTRVNQQTVDVISLSL